MTTTNTAIDLDELTEDEPSAVAAAQIVIVLPEVR